MKTNMTTKIAALGVLVIAAATVWLPGGWADTSGGVGEELPGGSPGPARGKGAAPIRAGVYSGDGASPACVIETYEALRIDGGIEPSLIGPLEIYTGGLDALDVLIFPGGSGSRQHNSLGSACLAMIRRFVLEEGKGVVGLCAGGYLVSDSEGYPCLRLIGADTADREHNVRGSALVEVALTEKGREFFPELKDHGKVYIQYHNGPLFIPAAGDGYAACEELAVNHSDVHHKGNAPAGVTPGKSFLLRQEAGRGRVMACAGHPEATAGMRWMVPRMVRWVARREPVRYPDHLVRPQLGTGDIMHSDEYEMERFWRLFDENPDARIAALRELRELRYRNGFRWACGMLRDASPAVRAFAAGVLADAEHTAAIEDLAAVIARESDADCRGELQAALARLKGMIGH